MNWEGWKVYRPWDAGPGHNRCKIWMARRPRWADRMDGVHRDREREITRGNLARWE